MIVGTLNNIEKYIMGNKLIYKTKIQIKPSLASWNLFF